MLHLMSIIASVGGSLSGHTCRYCRYLSTQLLPAKEGGGDSQDEDDARHITNLTLPSAGTYLVEAHDPQASR